MLGCVTELTEHRKVFSNLRPSIISQVVTITAFWLSPLHAARCETTVQVWAQRYHESGETNSEATAIALDSSGNVFVTGFSYVVPRTSDYSTTIAYSGAGVPLWTNRFRGQDSASARANGMAVDAGGNVFVTG